MNPNWNEYKKNKEDVISILNKTIAYFNKYGKEQNAINIKELERSVSDGRFVITVVGEFSTGKSTFLNALMGEKYLPSFTSETTANINFLKNKSEAFQDEDVCIHYKNGKIKIIDKCDDKTLLKYISTKNDDKDEISYLELFLNSPFLENKVTLVDSPGLNGIFDGHREITENQIEKSHACIFLFSAEQVGKETDFKFLKELRSKVNTIFLVLNKIDLIKETEGQTVENTINKLIHDYKTVFPDEYDIPEIIPVASYPALVARSRYNLDYPSNVFNLSKRRKKELENISNMKQFEDRLIKFLTQGEKTITELKEPLLRVINLLNLEKNVCDNKLIILKTNEKDDEFKFDENILALKKEIQDLSKFLEQKKSEIKKSFIFIEKDVYSYVEKLLQDFRFKIYNDIELNMDTENFEKFDKRNNNLIKKGLLDIFDKACNLLKEKFYDILVEKYSDSIIDFSEKADNLKFDIKIFSNIYMEYNRVDFGVEKYTDKINVLENEIQEINKKLDNVEIQKAENIRLVSEKNQLIEQLEQKQDKKQFYEFEYNPPLEKIRQEQREVVVDREGILGRLLDKIFGKKQETIYSLVVDEKEKKDYIKKFNRLNIALEKEISDIQKELKLRENAENLLKDTEKERVEVEVLLYEKLGILEHMRKEFEKEFEQKHNEELERIRTGIKNQFETIIDKFFVNTKEELLKIKIKYQNILKYSIENQVELKLQEKKEELELHKNMKKEKLDSINFRISIIEQNKQEILDIMKEAVEILSNIDNIEVDFIELKEI